MEATNLQNFQKLKNNYQRSEVIGTPFVKLVNFSVKEN